MTLPCNRKKTVYENILFTLVTSFYSCNANYTATENKVLFIFVKDEQKVKLTAALQQAEERSLKRSLGNIRYIFTSILTPKNTFSYRMWL